MNNEELLKQVEGIIDSYQKETQFYKSQFERMEKLYSQALNAPIPQQPVQQPQEPQPQQRALTQPELSPQDVYKASQDPQQWAKVMNLINEQRQMQQPQQTAQDFYNALQSGKTDAWGNTMSALKQEYGQQGQQKGFYANPHPVVENARSITEILAQNYVNEQLGR